MRSCHQLFSVTEIDLIAKSVELLEYDKKMPFLKSISHFRLRPATEIARTKFSRLIVGVSMVVCANVKLTTKRLDHYYGIMSREQSFCSRFSDYDRVVGLIVTGIF